MSAMTSVSGAGLKASVASRPVAGRQMRVVCQQAPRPVEQRKTAALGTMAAGLAAAALLVGGSAHAGVVLVQPDTKKVFQGGVAQAPAAKAEAPKKAEKKAESSEGGGFNAGGLVLPATVLGLVGGGFALSKIDPGFEEVFQKTVIKDSNIDGAGYENVLKNGGPVAAAKPARKTIGGRK